MAQQCWIPVISSSSWRIGHIQGRPLQVCCPIQWRRACALRISVTHLMSLLRVVSMGESSWTYRKSAVICMSAVWWQPSLAKLRLSVRATAGECQHCPSCLSRSVPDVCLVYCRAPTPAHTHDRPFRDCGCLELADEPGRRLRWQWLPGECQCNSIFDLLQLHDLP